MAHQELNETVWPDDTGMLHKNPKNLVGMATQLAKNPYLHPVAAGALSGLGTVILASDFNPTIERLLPHVPETAATAAACIAVMSIAASGVTIAKDSFAIAKILKSKVEDRFKEHEEKRADEGSRVTVAGVIAAAAASAKSIGQGVAKAAQEWAAPFVEGFRESKNEPVWNMQTGSIAMDAFSEVIGGGPGGEKAAKNALAIFTGASAKMAGVKVATAATVIAIMCRNSDSPVAYAAACTTVGAFAVGAISASLHRAREKLENGGNTGGALISSAIELGSVMESAGAIGAIAIAHQLGSAAPTALGKIAEAYDKNPAIKNVVEVAQKYIHKAMQSGLDRTSAIEGFISTHSLLIAGAQDEARKNISELLARAGESAEFLKKHTIDSPLMETKIAEVVKEKLREKSGELLREKIEASIEHGVELKESAPASTLFKRKIGAAFGKLADLGPEVAMYLAAGVPPLPFVQIPPQPSPIKPSRKSPIGYGVHALAQRQPAHKAKKHRHS